jgi:catechol 2,3-dioxygenase-like lactoylglutathione lyase family enzyme
VTRAVRIGIALLCAFVAAPVSAQSPRAPALPGEVIGVGNFAHIVADLDASLALYRDVLGLQVYADGRDGRRAGRELPAKHRDHSRHVAGNDVDRVHEHRAQGTSGRTQDPGTAILQLIVRDVTALTKKLKDAGVPVVTTGGVPVDITPPGLKISLVRDPNNMLVELVERPK